MNEIPPLGNELKEQPTESKSLTILGIIFFVIGALISLLQVLIDNSIASGTTDSAYQAGYIFGNILARILVIAILILIARHVFKKKKGLALMILSIIFLVISFIMTSKAIDRRAEENRLNHIAMDKFVSMSRDYTSGKDLTPEKFKKSDYGSMAPLLSFIEQYYISCKKLSTNLDTEIIKLNFQTILQADTFSSSDKIENAQQRLHLSINSFNQFESDAKKMMDKMPAEMDNLDIPKDFKDDFVIGFQEAQLKSGDRLKNYIQIEKDLVKKMDELMSFMLNEKGNYEVKNKEIYFYSNDDIAKYNKFIDDIQKLAAQETSTINEMKNMRKQSLDKLEKLNK